MENSIQQAYHDSPAPQTPTTPASKPLPALPVDTPPYSDDEDIPYHDEAPYRDDPPTPSSSSAPTTAQQPQPQQYTPYTDTTPPPTPTPRLESSDDDIPLAHFLLNPYPHEAPPSYAVAIRQTQSRDTLIQYIPTLDEDAHARIQSSYQQFMQQQQEGWSPSHHPPRAHRGRGRSVVIDIDEEAGLDGERSDDVRHSVEKIVAMFVVAGLLLVLSGVMAWLAFGSGLV